MLNKLTIFILFIFLDVISKYFVKNNLVLNQSIKINEFLDLIYVKIMEFLWFIFRNFIPLDIYYDWFNYSLIIFYLMIISNKKLEKIAYFIIIGAIGNISDRFINTL